MLNKFYLGTTPLVNLRGDVDRVELQKGISFGSLYQGNGLLTTTITDQTLHYSQDKGENFLSWGAVGGWGTRYPAGTEQMSTPALQKSGVTTTI